jgi:hypothetical protein
MYTDHDVIWTSDDGKSRAVVTSDAWAEMPYDDGGSPILRIDSTILGAFAASQVTEVTSYVLPADIASACEHYGPEGGDKFARYLRIWHGVTAIESYGPNDSRATDSTFLTFDPADWRELVGAPAGSISLDEWRAYCEGDVWTVALQELVTWERRHGNGTVFETREEWETYDSCSGFYGYEYAVQSANDYRPASVTT